VSEIGVFAYCAAMGFVAAATIASFYQWMTSERPDFAITRQTGPGMAVAVLISMFGGPFIVVQKVWAGLRSRELRTLPALVGVAVAVIWSVCAGVFYVSLRISA
jgi:hypothetical protein